MGESGETPAATDPDQMVSMYNEMFKYRYTDDDAEYVKTRDNPLPNPPCVENWYQRPKRNFDFTRGGRGGRGGYNRGHGDRYHGRDNRDQDRWGGGNRVHYPGRRDDRQQNRYQPYDQGQRHRQGQWR